MVYQPHLPVPRLKAPRTLQFSLMIFLLFNLMFINSRAVSLQKPLGTFLSRLRMFRLKRMTMIQMNQRHGADLFDADPVQTQTHHHHLIVDQQRHQSSMLNKFHLHHLSTLRNHHHHLQPEFYQDSPALHHHRSRYYDHHHHLHHLQLEVYHPCHPHHRPHHHHHHRHHHLHQCQQEGGERLLKNLTGEGPAHHHRLNHRVGAGEMLHDNDNDLII